MNLSKNYPDLSEHIAEAIEQLGNIPEALLQGIEQAAQLIAGSLLADGKILLATSVETHGLGDAFHFDLLERHKQLQPGLPVVQLPVYGNDGVHGFLRSAEILGLEPDVLLLVSDTTITFEKPELEQLHLNRGINSVYLGPDSHSLGVAGFSTTLPLVSVNKYRQLEMTLFILHCLSVRIQSIVFQGIQG